MKFFALIAGSFFASIVSVFFNNLTGGKLDFALPVILLSFIYFKGYFLFIWLAMLSLWLSPYLGKESLWIYIFFLGLYIMIKFINKMPYLYTVRLLLSIVAVALVYDLFVLDWLRYLSNEFSINNILRFIIIVVLQSMFTYFVLWLIKITKNYFLSPQKARLK